MKRYGAVATAAIVVASLLLPTVAQANGAYTPLTSCGMGGASLGPGEYSDFVQEVSPASGGAVQIATFADSEEIASVFVPDYAGGRQVNTYNELFGANEVSSVITRFLEVDSSGTPTGNELCAIFFNRLDEPWVQWVTPEALPDGIAGDPYDLNLVAEGRYPPACVDGGEVDVPGLTLTPIAPPDTEGASIAEPVQERTPRDCMTISGTPTTPGQYELALVASVGDHFIGRTFTLTVTGDVAPAPPQPVAPTAPAATVSAVPTFTG